MFSHLIWRIMMIENYIEIILLDQLLNILCNELSFHNLQNFTENGKNIVITDYPADYVTKRRLLLVPVIILKSYSIDFNHGH